VSLNGAGLPERHSIRRRWLDKDPAPADANGGDAGSLWKAAVSLAASKPEAAEESAAVLASRRTA